MMKFYGLHQYLIGYGNLPLVIFSAVGVRWLLLADR
jgi:hypothetical protein